MQNILLAEDSEDDVFLFTRALWKSRAPCTLHVVNNGMQAVDYLSGAGRFADRRQFPLPHFLLLDLKLPLLNGLDVLQWIRRDPLLKDLPVAMYTHHYLPADIHRAHELGADAYFIKPRGEHQLGEMVKHITQSWFRCGAFPDMLR